MKFHFLLLPLIGFMLSGCSSQIDLDNLAEPPRLMAWGIIYPDSLPKVYVYSTFSPFDTPDSTIRVSGASVHLLENGQPVDSLLEIAPGVYQAMHYFPKTGLQYAVTVQKNGFETLETAPDLMPDDVPVDSIFAVFRPNPGSPGKTDALIYLKLGRAISDDLVGTKSSRENYSAFPVSYSSVPTNLCDVLPNLKVYQYQLRDYSCLETYTSIVLNNSIIDNVDVHRKWRLSAGFFSPKSTDLFKQIAIFYNYNVDAVAINVFYEPVFIPIEAKGGYGFVSCCNAIDTLIQF
jgi:Domain of unknown function (DUF4249)